MERRKDWDAGGVGKINFRWPPAQQSLMLQTSRHSTRKIPTPR